MRFSMVSGELAAGDDGIELHADRMFHAVSPECTSAVTPEIEQVMYEHCTKLGITLMSGESERASDCGSESPPAHVAY